MAKFINSKGKVEEYTDPREIAWLRSCPRITEIIDEEAKEIHPQAERDTTVIQVAPRKNSKKLSKG